MTASHRHKPLDIDPQSSIRDLEVRFAERLALLDNRVSALQASTLERLAGIETRLHALQLPEYLAAVQTLLREQFKQLEWLAQGMVRMRSVTKGFFEDIQPESDPLAGAMPDLAAIGAALNGAEVKTDGLPPELAQLLASAGLKLK